MFAGSASAEKVANSFGYQDLNNDNVAQDGEVFQVYSETGNYYRKDATGAFYAYSGQRFATLNDAGGAYQQSIKSQTSFTGRVVTAVTSSVKNGIMDNVTDFGIQIISIIANGIMWVTSWFLWLSGILLNLVITFTIEKMSSFVKPNGVLVVVWTLFRDMANIVFIGLLLHAAFKMILGGVQAGQAMLPKIIISALLINFSFFFTSLVIDASNTLTLTFYNAIVKNNPVGGADNTGFDVKNINSYDGGLSAVIMNSLKMPTVYKSEVNTVTLKGSKWTEAIRLFFTAIAGSAFIIICAMVFMTTALLLLARFIVYLVLLMTSPFGFVGSLIPKLGASIGSRWQNALINNSIFAPVFFLFMWTTIKVIQSPEFRQIGDTRTSTVDFSAMITDGSSASVTFAFNYAVVIGMCLMSLIISKSIAAQTDGSMAKFASWASGKASSFAYTVPRAAGRQAVGASTKALGKVYDGATSRIANSKYVAGSGLGSKTLRGLAKVSGVSALDHSIRAGIKSGQTTKFGSMSYEDSAKRDKERGKVYKEHATEAKNADIVKDGLAAIESNSNEDAQKAVRDYARKLSPKEVAGLDKETRENKQFLALLTPTQLKKIAESDDEKVAGVKDKIAENWKQGITERISTQSGAEDLAKNLKPNEIAQLPKEVFANENFILSLTPSALSAIAKEVNDDAILGDIKDKIMARYNALPQPPAPSSILGPNGQPIQPPAGPPLLPEQRRIKKLGDWMKNGGGKDIY